MTKNRDLHAFLQPLKNILGDHNVLTDSVACEPYGRDKSNHFALPDVVAFAQVSNQIQEIIKLCNRHQIPLVARGGGTGTPGGAVPSLGGLVLSLEKMDRILSVDPENRVMVVEPGVTNQNVQDAAAQYGFFWPPDPASAATCTIGGNLAYNSAGPRAIKYGTPRENTLGLRAIIGTGEEIRTGVYTTKGVVGYDLTRLLIGSEGTLAIITQATLKLTPLPADKRTLRITYRDTASAATAVSRMMAQAATPCALEFLDSHAIHLMRNFLQQDTARSSFVHLPDDVKALLIVEIDSLTSAMNETITHITQAAQTPGLLEILLANTPQETKQLWDMRKALSPALRYVAPKKINEDIVVPVSRIPEFLSKVDEMAQRYQIIIVNFGHAGNGNIHVNLMIDPQNNTQRDNAKKCLNEMFSLVLKLGGTLSGEHGVGIEKRDFIAQEIDPISLQIMKDIKKIFDPNGILNPGKIF